jgi:hypothetical protein
MPINHYTSTLASYCTTALIRHHVTRAACLSQSLHQHNRQLFCTIALISHHTSRMLTNHYTLHQHEHSTHQLLRDHAHQSPHEYHAGGHRDATARIEDFRLILSRSKVMTSFLLTFTRELSTTKDQFGPQSGTKMGPWREMTPYELINYPTASSHHLSTTHITKCSLCRACG